MKVETFKCATGAGWGILIDGLMMVNFPYQRTEHDAMMLWLAAADREPELWGDVLITTQHMDHYSNT